MGTPTRQEDFDPATLWKKADFRPVFANNVTASVRARQFGTEAGIGPLDDGALRVNNGKWQIFSTAFDGVWNDFDPDNLGHMDHANHFARYGAGWSSGGAAFTGHGPTNLGQMFVDQLGREATPEELQDASFGKDFGLDMRPPATQPQGSQQPPVPPPTPPAPPLQPPTKPVTIPPPPANSATQQVLPIRYTFGAAGRREDIVLPPGTTGVLFAGTILVPPLTGDAIRPWIGVRVGDKDGDRENAGAIGVGGREQVRFEAGGRRSEPTQGGFSKVVFGRAVPLEFEWAPGSVRVVYNKATRTFKTGTTEGCERGGMLNLGVDPGGEYVLLPKGTVLEGRLTITGGAAQPGSVNPVDPLPPTGKGVARAISLLEQALAELRGL